MTRAPAILLAFAFAAPAAAHDFTITRVDARLQSNGAYQIDLVCDLDELALGLPPGSNSVEVAARLKAVSDDEFDRLAESLRRLLRRRLRVRFDGQAVEPEVSFPECIRCAAADFEGGRAASDRLPAANSPGDAAVSRESGQATLTSTLSLEGRGSNAVTLTPTLSMEGSGSNAATLSPANQAPDPVASGREGQTGAGIATSGPALPTVFGIVARLTGRAPTDARAFSFRASRSFNVVHLTIHGPHAVEPTRYVLPAGEECPPFDLAAPPPPLSAGQAAWRYLRLGFEHILPLGLDHVLFVLALYLLAARWGPLLWQVTAFTLAHTLTLALSMYGVVSLPAGVVEPLIALSIACVGIENLLTSRLHPWRPAVVFGFGLLHGLGFAGVLTELGLPREQFVTALVSFNVGVELGQLAVIGLAFAAIGWCRKRPWYRRGVVMPLSLAVSAVALYWFVERVGWMG